jgi:4-hydroxythreonine-4-phosphate dehydrogenase
MLTMPPVGITMGCPAGVGPEIVLRLFEREQLLERVPPFVVLGEAGVLQRCAEELAIPCKIEAWQPGKEPARDRLNVLACSALDLADFAWGRPNLATGKAMARYIEEAVRLISEGSLSAMATCPIAKKTLQLAGYTYPGHTEMLAALCHSSQYGKSGGCFIEYRGAMQPAGVDPCLAQKGFCGGSTSDCGGRPESPCR